MKLSIILPTYNEGKNIEPLLAEVYGVLATLNFEVIVVDDNSPDGTGEVVRSLQDKFQNLILVTRKEKAGLSSAVMKGVEEAKGEVVLVMDADLQHDPAVVPQMLSFIEKGYDLVIGSRFIKDAELDNFRFYRVFITRISIMLSSYLFPSKIKDPLSGFFLIRKDIFNSLVDKLSGRGFKILLDILLSNRNLKIIEVPYKFRGRFAGESKLGPVVALEFVILLLEKRFFVRIPLDFVSYVAVGAFGVIVHLVTLFLFYKLFDVSFSVSQFFSALVAMGSNFYFNNEFTYFEKTKHNRDLFRGIIKFYSACLVGLLINVSISSFLNAIYFPWVVAGLLGAIISAIWNYVISKAFVWS